MLTVRDGLVPGHDPSDRLSAARTADVQGIWDLSHYHRNADPIRSARAATDAALAITGQERLWLCPVNEPSLYPIVDCPPWHAPRARRRWSHGLIRSDMSVDPALAAKLFA